MPRSDESWMSGAACKDLGFDVFFGEEKPTREERLIALRAAVAVCTDCPVRVPCATYAVDEGLRYGIWGGLSPERRQKLVEYKRM